MKLHIVLITTALFIAGHAPLETEGLLIRTKQFTRNLSSLKNNKGGGATPREFVAHATNGIQGDIRQFMAPTATIGENLKNAAESLVNHPGKAVSFVQNLCQVLHWQGFSFFFLMGWFFVPAMERPYHMFQERVLHRHNNVQASSTEERTTNTKPYRKSRFHLVVDHVAQACKIAFSVYVVDTIRIALQALGISSIPHLTNIPHAYMRVAYIYWIVDRISALKRHFVARKTNSHPDHLPPKVQFLNRVVDAGVYATGFFAAVAAVKADLGTAAKGFVALGSFGTLAVSLATQNLATQIVSGLFLDLSNRFHKGDSVRLGNNGHDGAKIEKMGWLHTEMRGSDDIKVVVPNKVLVDKEVSNLSRVKTSQVKQQLQFKYQDVHKLPDLMEAIKDEIRTSCPDVITDGSRPFRAHFDNFGNKLEVTVEAHFHIEPLSDDYHENRQEVLLAITRAVENHNVQFAQA